MLPILVAFALGAGPRAAQPPCAPAAANDAAPAADRGAALVTVPAAAGAEAPLEFRAWGVELRLEGARPAAGAAPAPSEVRLTRVADARAGATSRLRTSGRRLPVVWVAYAAPPAAPGGGAGGARDTVRVRLVNVTVAAQRLTVPDESAGAEEQLAAAAVAVCQLATDSAEAARRQTELQALDRRKFAAPYELARAGDQLRLLEIRLEAARRRLRTLAERAAWAAVPTEELTLRAERAEVAEAADGARPAPGAR